MIELDNYNSIVICGPTACGKTRIGVELAAKFSGEIISADSRQVYRGMDIGSGKDLSEYTFNEKQIPYHCIDIANPDEVYTLYKYIADFNRSFSGILSRKALPVIVGGTGLYIEAAVKQYDVPHAPEDSDLRNDLMQYDIAYLSKKLLNLDENRYHSTDLSSKKRIVRSLEIAMSKNENDTEGKTVSKIDIRPLIFGIRYPRETVKERIDQRLEARLNSGMVEEVKKLIDDGVSRERILMFGMEYKYIALYIWGEMSYDEMKETLRNEIHRLSKRQMTWFRGMERRGSQMIWIDNGDIEQIVNHIKKVIVLK